MAKAKATGDETVVKQILDDFNLSWKYASSSYHATWQECWKLYNNQRIDKAYQGISNTFVPMTFSTIETMVAALAGGKPKFDYVPTSAVQRDDVKVLNAMLDYYWDCDQWNIKVVNWIRNVLVYGTGIMFVYWDIDKPRLMNIPLRDFIIDPQATSIETARYVGHRFLTTRDQLKQFQVADPATGELVPLFSNIDSIPKWTKDSSKKLDKQQKDMWLGSTLEDKEAAEEQVEVIMYWTEEKQMALGNRETLILNTTNPYLMQAQARGFQNPKGLKPYISQRNYSDESLFYGKGEIEPIKQHQELLNDLTNQNIDAVTYTLNPMYTLDPTYVDWIDKVENLPGAVYPFAKDALNRVDMGTVTPQAFSERLNIKQEIRETTAASEITKGVEQQGAGATGEHVTATEVNAQMNQAGQRFSIKLTQLENEGYHQLAKVVFDMTQLFVDQPVMVRVATSQGVSWQSFDPTDYSGVYEPKVQLEASVERDKADAAQKYQLLLTSFLGDPMVNQQELVKLALTRGFDLDPDEADLLLTPAPGMMPGMAPAPGAPGMAPGMPPGAPAGPGGPPAPAPAPSPLAPMAM